MLPVVTVHSTILACINVVGACSDTCAVIRVIRKAAAASGLLPAVNIAGKYSARAGHYSCCRIVRGGTATSECVSAIYICV